MEKDVIRYAKTKKGFIGQSRLLPGVITQSDTLGGLQLQIKDAMKAYLMSVIETLDNDNFDYQEVGLDRFFNH